jgi:AraC-like DNA-binding protein
VADAMYVTPRHVSRIFNEYFGTSFGKTLSIYRLSYAKNYLCDTDYPVEKIATLVGFASPQSLYKLFKEREKMTIKKYRDMHNKS